MGFSTKVMFGFKESERNALFLNGWIGRKHLGAEFRILVGRPHKKTSSQLISLQKTLGNARK